VKGLLSRPGVLNTFFRILHLKPHIASSQHRETLNITISQIKLLSLFVVCCYWCWHYVCNRGSQAVSCIFQGHIGYTVFVRWGVTYDICF